MIKYTKEEIDRMTPLQKHQAIFEIYNAKEAKPTELAKAFGYSNPNKINEIMRNLGGEALLAPKITQQQKEEIKDLIDNQKMSIPDIAKKMDVDESTVRRNAKKMGCKVLGQGEKRKFKIAEDFFHLIDNEKKSYYLGLLFADGSVRKEGSSLNIDGSKKKTYEIKLSLHENDRLTVENFSSEIYGFVKTAIDKRIMETKEIRNYHYVTLYSKNMVNDLIFHGCTPVKSLTLNFPANIPNNLMRHFIRGYLDGDGCICNTDENRPRIDFTGTQSFLTSLKEHLEKTLNISIPKISNPEPNGITCSLQIGDHSGVFKILNYLYKDAVVYMERKYNKSIDALKILQDKKDKNYGSTLVPIISDQKLTSKYLKTLSLEEKQKLINPLFDFYRSNGFPYPEMNNDELIQDFTALKNKDHKIIEKDKKLNINTTTGSDFIKHFSPQIFEVKSSLDRRPSLLEGFNDDTILKNTLKNRLEGNYNIHGDMIRQGLANSKNCFKSSIFNCTIAKYFYETFCQDDDIVYDYSMGFGHRLLACLSSRKNIKYVGVDPYNRSASSNLKILEFIKNNIPSAENKTASITCCGSEYYRPQELENKVSLAFSSPPYYNLEVYEENKNQAYSNGYMSFLKDYWIRTVENIYFMLKEDGYFILNIKDQVGGFNLSEDMLSVAYKNNFKLIETYQIELLKNSNFNGKKNQNKYEPIYILKK